MPKKQKSGLYRSKVKIGEDAEGNPINKWISGKTKKELEQARKEVEDYYINGAGVASDRLFGEYAQEWFRVRKEPFISASSKAAYQSMLNKHITPEFGDRNLRSIRPIDLQAWVNGFQGASKSQIILALSILRGLFGAAISDRLVERDPAVGLRRPDATPPKEKKAFTDDERKSIRATFRTHAHGLYLAVMYYTGMRPGEVRGLQWGDVDFKEGLIHVQRDIDYAAKGAQVGELKTRAADRYVPISDDLRALMAPVRGLPGMFVFTGIRSHKPLDQSTAKRMWIELMQACGMIDLISQPEGSTERDIRKLYRPTITPHTRRHNFITMCWESGMDVLLTMKIVGHADIKTTMNIYTHLSKAQLDKAKDKVNFMFDPNKVAIKLHNAENDGAQG